jgi:PTH1 family peptidyl-tRNA hydrolase
VKLIVGLGNPGSQYSGTRHNVGFDVVRELARRFNGSGPQTKYKAEVIDIHIGSQKVLLIAPMTFMNCSGESVIQFVNFYQPDLDDLAVICDDMNLPCGRIRWRAKGSAGGQNGLKDIIQRVGSPDFPRLRIGIGRPPGRMDTTSWVLGRFRSEEQELQEVAKMRAADSVEMWVREGVNPVMTEYNRDLDA